MYALDLTRYLKQATNMASQSEANFNSVERIAQVGVGYGVWGVECGVWGVMGGVWGFASTYCTRLQKEPSSPAMHAISSSS